MENVEVPGMPRAPVPSRERGELLVDPDHPDDLGTHRSGEHLCRDTVVASKRQGLPGVVQQRGDDEFGISSSTLCPGRGLERVVIVVDSITGFAATQ